MLQRYFETIDPLGDLSDKDFVDYLYSKSMEIEPRYQKPPKFVSSLNFFIAATLSVSADDLCCCYVSDLLSVMVLGSYILELF